MPGAPDPLEFVPGLPGERRRIDFAIRRTAGHIVLGLHEQPALAGRFRLGAGPLPVTERLSRYGFYLPSGPVLTEAELETVARAVDTVFDEL